MLTHSSLSGSTLSIVMVPLKGCVYLHELALGARLNLHFQECFSELY